MKYLYLSFLIFAPVSISIARELPASPNRGVALPNNAADISKLVLDSDVIIYGRIKALRPFHIELFDEHSTDIVLDQVVSVQGTGNHRIGAEVVLRQLGKLSDRNTNETLLRTKALYFIKDNGKSPTPQISFGIKNYKYNLLSKLLITDKDTMTDKQGGILVSISDSGVIQWKQVFNQCQLRDMPEMEGLVLDSNGNQRKQTRRELMDEVMAFTCPNGSKWRRGNDRPPNFIDELLSLQRLVEVISQIQAANGLNRSNIKSIISPPRGPLKRENQYLNPNNIAVDEIYLQMLNSTNEPALPQKLLENIYLREKARARKNNRDQPDLPATVLQRIPEELVNR